MPNSLNEKILSPKLLGRNNTEHFGKSFACKNPDFTKKRKRKRKQNQQSPKKKWNREQKRRTKDFIEQRFDSVGCDSTGKIEEEYPFKISQSDPKRDLLYLKDYLSKLASGRIVREKILQLKNIKRILEDASLEENPEQFLNLHRKLLQSFSISLEETFSNTKTRSNFDLDSEKEEMRKWSLKKVRGVDTKIKKLTEFWERAEVQHEFRERIQKLLYRQFRFYRQRRHQKKEGNRQRNFQIHSKELKELKQQVFNLMRKNPVLEDLIEII